MACSEEDVGDAGEAKCGADRADQEQRLPADTIDDGHSNHREEKVGATDGHGLEVAGNPAVAGGFENVVDVIEDGIDARKLVEHTDGDGEENRETIFPGEQGITGGVLGVDGLNDVLEFLLVVLLADLT